MTEARQAALARTWGLVSLGALAIVAMRILLVFCDEWVSFRRRMDWRVLSSRMSQLKPWVWKAQLSGWYLIILVAAVGVALFVLFVLGVREAMQGEDGPKNE